jgi:hypothetical protein
MRETLGLELLKNNQPLIDEQIVKITNRFMMTSPYTQLPLEKLGWVKTTQIKGRLG